VREYSGTLLHLPPKTKQKPISKTMKPIISTTIKLGAISLLLLFQACKDDTTEEKAQSTDELQIQYENVNDDSLTNNKSGPRNRTETALASFAFQNSYTTNNGKLNYSAVIVKLDTSVRNLLKMHPTTNDEGLVVHYALSQNMDTIQYILSLGSQNSKDSTFTFSPFENPAGPYYILLDGDTTKSVKFIDQKRFCTLVKNYENNVKLKSETPTRGNNHPLMAYHQGKELNMFLENNAQFNPTHLFIIHGADTIGRQTERLHLPYLVFGNKYQPTLLNNTKNLPRYERRALDLGHPCPTYCRPPRETQINCP